MDSLRASFLRRWRIGGGNKLEANIRVEDADTYYEPWSGIQHYDRVERPMTEQLCAENNQHLFDYQIPVALWYSEISADSSGTPSSNSGVA